MPQVMEEIRRIGIHSHIRGLGLDHRTLNPLPIADGLVGQIEARKAAGLMVELIRRGRRAGHGLLLAGPVGTGKTAIALGMARELGRGVPFVSISGSSIYSAGINKTEFLTQTIRRAIGVKIKETREVYEGEVERIRIKKAAHPLVSYMEIPVGALITLKTTEEKRTIEVGQEIALELLKQRVEEGDVVMIEAATGRLTVMGSTRPRRVVEGEEEKEVDYTLGIEKVETPAGPIRKRKEFTYTLTLHDLDMANISTGRMFGFMGEEISDEVRKAVDERVNRMIFEKMAELIPGVLFIDEAHMLDIEAFAFLNRAMEQEFAPILVLATNRGTARIRGTDIESPHGIPLDLLDRLLIANTKLYNRDEIREILKLRIREEEVKVEEEALEYLVALGEQASLRYASQLLLPAKIIAEKDGEEKVKREHVAEAERVFVDVRRSIEHIRATEKGFLV